MFQFKSRLRAYLQNLEIQGVKPSDVRRETVWGDCRKTLSIRQPADAERCTVPVGDRTYGVRSEHQELRKTLSTTVRKVYRLSKRIHEVKTTQDLRVLTQALG